MRFRNASLYTVLGLTLVCGFLTGGAISGFLFGLTVSIFGISVGGGIFWLLRKCWTRKWYSRVLPAVISGLFVCGSWLPGSLIYINRYPPLNRYGEFTAIAGLGVMILGIVPALVAVVFGAGLGQSNY